METYLYKLQTYLQKNISNIQKPKILEFDVREGALTNIFLEICDKNDGELYSIDVMECSHLFKNPKWKFIKARDLSIRNLLKKCFYIFGK